MGSAGQFGNFSNQLQHGDFYGLCLADVTVLDFAEQPVSHRRWPLAMDIDRDFVVELRSFLHSHTVTRNGRAGATPKLMSGGQIVNVLGQRAKCLTGRLSV